MSLSQVALLLGLAAAIVNNLGLGFQKQGSAAFAEWLKSRRLPAQWRGLLTWWLGTALCITAVALLFPALKWGPASVIASFGGVGVATLAAFSICILKEPVTSQEGLGLGFIAIGTSITGLLAGSQGNAGTPCLSALPGLGGAALVGIVCLAGLGGGRPGWRGLTLAITAGGLAGVSLLFQKLATTTGPLFLVGWILSGLLSFVLLQMAYLRGKAVTVVPTYSCAAILAPVAAAPWLFGDTISPEMGAGLALLLTGIILLGRGSVAAVASPSG